MKRALLFLLFFVTACSVNNKYFSDGKNWIPADFDPAKSMLLVERYPGKEKWNASVQEFLDKKYQGKYEIVSKEDILAINGKYSDTKVYKYAVLWGIVGSTSNSTFTGGPSVDYMYTNRKVDFYGHFLERATGKEYPVTKKYNNYGWKGYVPFFNSVIKYSK